MEEEGVVSLAEAVKSKYGWQETEQEDDSPVQPLQRNMREIALSHRPGECSPAHSNDVCLPNKLPFTSLSA